MSNSKGQIEFIVLIAVVILFAFFASGGLFAKKTPSPQPNQVTVSNACCDTADCSPSTTQTVLFNGTLYGLLKSEVTLTEGTGWIQDSGEKTDGKPIILNTSNQANECGRGVDDQVESGGCVAIPNDQLVYVCKDPTCLPLQNDTVYDVYFRLSDIPTPGVPDVIKQCNTSPINAQQPGRRQIIVEPTTAPDEPAENLQIKHFEIKLLQGTAPWLSPWCKPAIYLYPQERTQVNVSIAPQGKLTLTIPHYPSTDGWNVTADPTGNITYQNESLDYLYYEAEISDNLIEKPNKGLVVAYDTLANLFNILLPKLGLSEKEASQFSQYWLKALPKSSYYFIGIVAANNLNEIAPITINPLPNTVIRVTLYFQALDEMVNVEAPTITTPTRDGFTVVEWGGIVKTDPSHPFSCLM